MLTITKRVTKRVAFENSNGERIVGILDSPLDHKIGTAIYASCFTCGKDIKAAARIARRLSQLGITVLRFDFRGLGDSSGDFAESNFSTHQEDLLTAADFLSSEGMPPQLLIGHSLGGAACIAVANQIPSARGVCTLAAPSDTKHLAEFLSSQDPAIEQRGEGSVEIGGRRFTMRPQLLDDLKNHAIKPNLESLELPLLVMHSPVDQTLGYHHAANLVAWAKGPASLITLAGSDHLFIEHPKDIPFISTTIAAWAVRYVFD